MLTELKQIISGSCLLNEPMSRHTTYGIGGPADAYVIPKDPDDLRTVLSYARKANIPTVFLGSGSNILVSDLGIRGIVISLKKEFSKLVFDENHVSVGAGVKLGKLVKEAAKHRLTGCENLIGIPGTVGGAIFMNAGAYGQEVSAYLMSLDIMNKIGIVNTLSSESIKFEYRHTSLFPESIILRAEFQFPNDDAETIQKNMKESGRKRKSSQPLNFRSAGSVFKNPDDVAAGYLIDKAGLKGTISGNALISEKHANFFVNTGNATAEDILNLIHIARTAVKNKFDIDLELEITLLGFNSEIIST